MAINEHYNEVMDVIDRLFVYIFNGLNAKYGEPCALWSCRLQGLECFRGTLDSLGGRGRGRCAKTPFWLRILWGRVFLLGVFLAGSAL